MHDAFVKRGVGHTIVRCIKATLEGRLATATLNNSYRRNAESRGRPQGGELLPLLWCLVIDDLIARLTGVVYILRVTLIIFRGVAVGKFPNRVSDSCCGPFTPYRIGAARSVCWLISKKTWTRICQGKETFWFICTSFVWSYLCTVLWRSSTSWKSWFLGWPVGNMWIPRWIRLTVYCGPMMRRGSWDPKWSTESTSISFEHPSPLRP
jgi:hypothetical protein